MDLVKDFLIIVSLIYMFGLFLSMLRTKPAIVRAVLGAPMRKKKVKKIKRRRKRKVPVAGPHGRGSGPRAPMMGAGA